MIGICGCKCLACCGQSVAVSAEPVERIYGLTMLSTENLPICLDIQRNLDVGVAHRQTENELDGVPKFLGINIHRDGTTCMRKNVAVHKKLGPADDIAQKSGETHDSAVNAFFRLFTDYRTEGELPRKPLSVGPDSLSNLFLY